MLMQARKAILQCVEPLSMRPPCVEEDVLWYYDDCMTDRKYGRILTETNRSRLKMNIAICKTDGTKISSDLYKSMRDHANLVIRRLLEGISLDPCIVRGKSLTKLVIKPLFYEEFCQAILDLEAEKRELHLCAGHWKAEKLRGVRRGKSDGPHIGGGLCI